MRAKSGTFDEAVSRHKNILDNSERLLRQLTSAGVRGQLRDFTDIVDINRAALDVIINDRGPMLRREWSNL